MLDVTVTINGTEISVPGDCTVLQACEIAGHEIPRFCYHERLKIAGNCRMCLVEVTNNPKPVASCAMPVAPGMTINTDSKKVQEMRKSVMEMLLINHPLDCPICDQGGECDLQDQAIKYGSCISRYNEDKRAVSNKNFGSLVKTTMTRCIHCTRCVRFMEDVAGTGELATRTRGEDMEIVNYQERPLRSKMSGNIIDLCPVGALTSKPYEFKARSWELKKIESICIHDALGSAIRVDSARDEVLRILPRLNEDINEEWISDKSRFAYDGLRNQRLDYAYINQNGILEKVEIEIAINFIASKLRSRGSKIGAICGGMADAESMFLLKKLMHDVGSSNYCTRSSNSYFSTSCGAHYVFNTKIRNIIKSDACLLVGCNPEHEATVLNSRIREAVNSYDMQVFNVGMQSDLHYEYEQISTSPAVLHKILDGNHHLSKILQNANNPIIIIGESSLSRKDGESIFRYCANIAQKYGMIRDDWNGFNILHRHAASVGALDLGIHHQNAKSIVENSDILYLLDMDEFDELGQISDNTFVIYQGHHGDAGAHRANVILPTAAPTEQNGIYVNTEGVLQNSYKSVSQIGRAILSCECIDRIIRRISGTHNYDSYQELNRDTTDALKMNRQWINVDINNSSILDSDIIDTNSCFYHSDSICRASRTMARCKAELSG